MYLICISDCGGSVGLVAKLCLTLTTPWTVTCQAPLSMEISQARMLDWVAISFSNMCVSISKSLSTFNAHFLKVLFMLYSLGPRHRIWFLAVQASCIFSIGYHKGPQQNQIEDKADWGSLLSLFWFNLCVSIPTPESWRTFAWFISVFVSEVPGVWQKCSVAVLGEIYAWRDIQWSTTRSWLWRDHRKAPAKMKPGSIQELPLLHHPKRGFVLC